MRSSRWTRCSSSSSTPPSSACASPIRRSTSSCSSGWGCPPGACVFVDDIERQRGGRPRAGLRGIHFRDTEQAIAELDALSSARHDRPPRARGRARRHPRRARRCIRSVRRSRRRCSTRCGPTATCPRPSRSTAEVDGESGRPRGDQPRAGLPRRRGRGARARSGRRAAGARRGVGAALMRGSARRRRRTRRTRSSRCSATRATTRGSASRRPRRSGSRCPYPVPSENWLAYRLPAYDPAIRGDFRYARRRSPRRYDQLSRRRSRGSHQRATGAARR